MACHNADKGGANQLGPNLWDVIGEPIGQGKGFAFSDALSKKGGSWNWDNLSQWLTSPRAFAPGTKMTFAGLGDPQDRANVIAFLNSHSDAPKPLPAAPAAANGSTGEQAAGNPPGNGPNNGPQKAGKEPRSRSAATGRRPAAARRGQDKSPRNGEGASDMVGAEAAERPLGQPAAATSPFGGGIIPAPDCTVRPDGPRSNSARSPTPRSRPRSSG